MTTSDSTTRATDDIRLVDGPDDALAARLDAELAEFNFDATGIRDPREFAAALHDEGGALMAGVQGWTWGATCWVERLWVREDARHRGLGRRLLIAVEIRSAGARLRPAGAHDPQLPSPRLLSAARIRNGGRARRLSGGACEPCSCASACADEVPVVRAALSIRAATVTERVALEALQRRASDVWEAYREQLAAHPDAIVLPSASMDSGWVRVAVADDERPIGFSVVIPRGAAIHELDGLFVEPRHMHHGVGRLLVEDAVARAARDGAAGLEVIAGPARGSTRSSASR
jgi:GNAT superfamily N-acetyltransferase